MDESSLLARRFFRLAASQPDTLFLGGEREFSYDSAAKRIIRQAQHFQAEANRSPIAISGSNAAEWVLGFLAARAAGHVAMLVSADTTEAQWREFGELVGPLYRYETDLDRGVLVNPNGARRHLPTTTGFCLPTSGSTGSPRLALRSDQSLLTEGKRYAQGFGLTATDRILVVLPLCHAFVLGVALGGALVSGCTLDLTPHFIPRAVQRLLLAGRGTILPLVPATARLLCHAFGDENSIPQNLRFIIIGAGPVSPELEQLVIERLGHRPARNYGSTETGATLGTVAGQTMAPDGATGIPLPGVEAAIMGTEQPGSLFIRVEAPFLGYLSYGNIDGSRVSPDQWYSTGDLATQDDHGWITISGRIGDGLRRGGRFIQPGEVERALKSHPQVTDAVVVGRRDEHGEDIIEAHIEHTTDTQPQVIALRRHLEGLLESYKLPTVWHLYSALPRTSGGKPDQTRLRDTRQYQLR